MIVVGSISRSYQMTDSLFVTVKILITCYMKDRMANGNRIIIMNKS